MWERIKHTNRIGGRVHNVGETGDPEKENRVVEAGSCGNGAYILHGVSDARLASI